MCLLSDRCMELYIEECQAWCFLFSDRPESCDSMLKFLVLEASCLWPPQYRGPQVHPHCRQRCSSSQIMNQQLPHHFQRHNLYFNLPFRFYLLHLSWAISNILDSGSSSFSLWSSWSTYIEQEMYSLVWFFTSFELFHPKIRIYFVPNRHIPFMITSISTSTKKPDQFVHINLGWIIEFTFYN